MTMSLSSGVANDPAARRLRLQSFFIGRELWCTPPSYIHTTYVRTSIYTYVCIDVGSPARPSISCCSARRRAVAEARRFFIPPPPWPPPSQSTDAGTIDGPSIFFAALNERKPTRLLIKFLRAFDFLFGFNKFPFFSLLRWARFYTGLRGGRLRWRGLSAVLIHLRLVRGEPAVIILP